MTKKQQVWSSKTTVFFTLFCTFLCRRCRTTAWNFLISCSMEDWTQDNDVLILFFEPRCSPLEYNFRKITNIWEIEWHGKREMNIETVCPTRCRTLIRVLGAVLGILGWTMPQNTLLAPAQNFTAHRIVMVTLGAQLLCLWLHYLSRHLSQAHLLLMSLILHNYLKICKKLRIHLKFKTICSFIY